MMHNNNIIVIWDIDSEKNKSILKIINSTVIMWNGYEDNIEKNYISILKLVQKNSFVYRQKYLNWVHSLNTIQYKNKELIKHFNIRQNFSFWSMSLFNEKCNFIKSTMINDAIKLIAFEDFKKDRNLEKIVLYSSNKHLCNCFKDWCKKNQVSIEIKICKKEIDNKKVKLSSIFFRAMPKILQSILWFFFYLKKRWCMRDVGLKEWLKSEFNYTFVSYFTNLNYAKLKKGSFESNFWGDLPQVLDIKKKKINWLHIWDESEQLKSSKDVIHSINCLNKKNNKNQIHVTLDSFLSVKVVFKTLCDWLVVIYKSILIKNIFFINYREGFNLSILQKEDWFNSVYGVDGLKNILFFNLLETAIDSLNFHKVCLYLQENQGWEFALIYSWKKHEKSFIFGVPHFTIRFWDLRYFFDKKYFLNKTKINFLRPDKILVNGPVARKQLLDIHYPKRELIDVEALRYNYLYSLSSKKVTYFKQKKCFNILVIGDYDAVVTSDQLYVLKKALESITFDLKIYFKPHPTINKRNIEFEKMNLVVTNSMLKDLFNDVDLVLSGSNSSASVDAYCFGISTAIHINQKTLNLSPLNNIINIDFYSNHQELKRIIIKNRDKKNIKYKRKNYFFLDSKIPLWVNFFDSLK